jgi:N-methyl-L-proline demethylase
VDYTALTGEGNIMPMVNTEGAFLLCRIGDAVASRNIHAAIYDGLRFGVRV